MNVNNTLLIRTLVAGAAVMPLTTLAGFGDGSITFAPVPPAAIPTMGGVGLLLLAVIVGFLAIHTLRNRQTGQHLASFMALGLCALISAGAGVNLISEATAVIADPEKPITNPAGETLVIEQGSFNMYRNQTGVPMKVVDLQEPPVCGLFVSTEDSAPLCELDLVVENDELCRFPCPFAESDWRLKTDVVKVGQADNGLSLYQFRYIGDSALYQGVMAQEVLLHTPSAVAVLPTGYMAVNYAELGLEMTKVE